MAPSSNWSRRPASQAGNASSNLAGVTMNETAEVMTEAANFKKNCLSMRKTFLTLQEEKGVSPRASVEGKMPSGLVNLNTQDECAIVLYMPV